MSRNAISGCFYLDSCVVLSEILGQHSARMTKFKKDVKEYEITCYVSESVMKECEGKIKKTTDFLGGILKDVIIVYLEGIRSPRKLDTAKVSNDDLHRIKEAFLTVNQTAREFDLITDPFQAVEEWIVEKLEREIAKPKGITLDEFVASLTATILDEINKLQSDFERIVELEADYITKSNQTPDPQVAQILVQNGIHQPDADHISVVASHQKNVGEKVIFLTFDYKSILLKWDRIRRVSNIICCDPIYGLSHLR